MYVFITILVLLFLVYVFLRKKIFYPYSVSSDYTYKMNKEPYILEIKNHKIVLPEEIDTNYTVFCKIKIKATLSGYLTAPYIEINDKKASRQYYEARTKGFRYINISNLYESDRIIKFKAKNCNISNKKIEIYAYKNEDISNSKILIIAPHPDDAEISSYGLYSKNADNTFILTITGGENGRDNYNVFNNSEKNDFARMKLRIWNSLTVAILGNVSRDNMLNLGYTDASLENMYKQQEKTFPIDKAKFKILEKMNSSYPSSLSKTEKSWATLVSDMEQVISNVQPDIIITPHPYLDKHKDHLYSTVAVAEALQKMNYDRGNLFLYTIHNTINRYYPFGKMGSMITLPPLFNSISCFNKLYSYKLSEDDQANKILAFEAMNDLRIGVKILSLSGVSYKLLDMLKRRIYDIRKDYYSQFVRSNELFYIIPFTEIETLIKKVLKNHK